MPTDDYKIILIGDSGVGKSSLVHWFLHRDYNKFTASTIGSSFCTKTLDIGNQNLRLNIWDTAGQERFRSMVQMYYKNTAGCFCVFDVTNRLSFENMRYWLDSYLEVNNIVNSKIIIVGNKSDIDRSFWFVSDADIKRLAKEYHCDYIFTSCLNGLNVLEAFVKMGSDIYYSEPAIPADDTFKKEKTLRLYGKQTLKSRLYGCC